MTLLSALLYSQQKGMLLIHFPTLFSFTHSNHTVEPYSSDEGTHYEQDEYVVNWLKYILELNPIIGNSLATDACQYGDEHMVKYTVEKGEKMSDVIERVINSHSYPSKVLGYILEQILKIPNRPPLMIAMDGLNALFSRTDVRLEQYGPPLMPRDLTVMRTIYDLVFSQKYTQFLMGKDSIVTTVTNRGSLSVKGRRKEDRILTAREQSEDFHKIFRPQALRESPTLNLSEETTPFYSNGKSYMLVGIEGELREMDRLVNFEFGQGETTTKIGIEKLLSQCKDWEVNIEVRDKLLYLHYKHLDEVAKEKILNANYVWRSEILLGEEGMRKMFDTQQPFETIELRNWQKLEVDVAIREAVKDLWGRQELNKEVVEEVYPLSSYGNPRLVYNLCRMVFEH